METIQNRGSSDREILAGMLARAFARDSLAVHVFPEDMARQQRLVAVHRPYLRVFSRSGIVITNSERSAAALWLPPGRYPLSLAAHLRLLPRMALATGLTALPSALHVLGHLEQMHPAGRRFWYLGVLGVEPNKQRTGLGSALLETGLRVCDKEGADAYLETAEPSNLPFYSVYGFEVLDTSELRNGPRVWSMWREARDTRDW
ncbi:GNAT family N-acetyltransferase [Paraburkholderia panacisoli]|uniref:GNAT family N-acetyltransferase n=1 Tax=Paraburkholderia panacisoli TaxID=2603818 RepID=A0A5B0G794_9BURK|nr:GNAT family N-acetyltransferase [Paraburkholderia panacisoli]KAA0998575.1 GNAT family N-acetyltransferase [Paraburkholderia panacisoli]